MNESKPVCGRGFYALRRKFTVRRSDGLGAIGRGTNLESGSKDCCSDGFFGDISCGRYLIHWQIFMSYDAIVARYLGSTYNFTVNFSLLAVRFCISFATAIFLA